MNEIKNRKYIAVAGNIGAGKSTLVQFLAKNYGVKPFFEPADQNPYLADFYLDMKRWAFHSQVFFLTHKYKIHQQLDAIKQTVVLDRTIYEDAEIFAAALHQTESMTRKDYETYSSLYSCLKKTLRPPDLMIYLKCSVSNLQKRIASRGRQIEKNVPVAYLKHLQKLYDEWIAQYNQSEILVIETDRLDYMTDLVHRVDVMKRMEAHF